MRSDGSGLVRLTPDDEARYAFGGWHPDGRRIAYGVNEAGSTGYDVHMLDLETGESELIYESEGIGGAAGFSPSGDRMLIRRTISSGETRYLVYRFDLGELRPLTPVDPPARFHYTYWSPDGRSIFTLTDRDRDFLTLARIDVETGELTYLRDDPWPAERLDVSWDATRAVIVFNRGGFSELVIWDLEADRELPPPDLPPGVIYGIELAPDGSRLAVELRTPRRPGEVWSYDLASGEVRRVTRGALVGIPESALGEPELVEYRSFDDLEISALLYRPPATADAAGPPPCLVYAHGGPASQSRPRYSSLVQYFVTRGYVVFAPNVRGSKGYGRTFMNLDNVERREDSVRDLLAGVRSIIEQGIVDSTRVAIYGGSYGGYMSLAALTMAPDLFAAGVASVGISNFVTFLENTGAYRRSHREREYGSLEHDRELLERISPLHRVDRIRAPLMLVHGANDRRVPVGEAKQIAAAVRERGGTVELLINEHEGHHITRTETRITTYTRVAEFVDRHLGVGVEQVEQGEQGGNRR
jgi:dipeptidyl aminopeptidase/acylaminoacyl peptidase